jgi:hypothetical protein
MLLWLVFAITATEWAGLIAAAGALATAAVGAYATWVKRHDEQTQRELEAEDGTVVIRQAQGANTILDATVRALNGQLERYAAEVDRERALRERAEAETWRLTQELRRCREDSVS